MAGHSFVQVGVAAGWRRSPQRVERSVFLWLTSMRMPHVAARVLAQVAAVRLAHRPYEARQRTMGRMFGRSERTARRAVAWLRENNYIQVVRRGRKLSNVYRLAGWVWERLTGQKLRPRPPAGQRAPEQGDLWDIINRLGVRLGFEGGSGGPAAEN